jgi:anti-sigma regulatory factor (Ser/Thr protein kinase)
VTDSTDIAVLRTPTGSRALPLLRVFISGFACRHDLSVDRIDDVQLAVETLVAEEPEGEGTVALEICPSGEGLMLRLEGLGNKNVRAALTAGDRSKVGESAMLDVRLLLESLVDTFQVADRANGRFAVEMCKRAS